MAIINMQSDIHYYSLYISPLEHIEDDFSTKFYLTTLQMMKRETIYQTYNSFYMMQEKGVNVNHAFCWGSTLFKIFGQTNSI